MISDGASEIVGVFELSEKSLVLTFFVVGP
jgi:hypothetical protein